MRGLRRGVSMQCVKSMSQKCTFGDKISTDDFHWGFMMTFLGRGVIYEGHTQFLYVFGYFGYAKKKW